MESRADSLRRSIETRLYLETLIPEFRGDVLGLLESSDKVMNRLTETLTQFQVETPEILEDLKPMFMESGRFHHRCCGIHGAGHPRLFPRIGKSA